MASEEDFPLSEDTVIDQNDPCPDTTYCNAVDVARVTQTETGYSSSTIPTGCQVNKHIVSCEEWIDRFTGHAWRERFNRGLAYSTNGVNNYEYHDIRDVYGPEGSALNLMHRRIREFDADRGDVFEVWNGSEWVDWLTSKTEGRANDYWVDYDNGFIYIRHTIMVYRKKAIRLKYRYGDEYIPEDVRTACAMLAAARVIMADDRSFNLSETGDPSSASHEARAQKWVRDARETLSGYREVKIF